MLCTNFSISHSLFVKTKANKADSERPKAKKPTNEINCLVMQSVDHNTANLILWNANAFFPRISENLQASGKITPANQLPQLIGLFLFSCLCVVVSPKSYARFHNGC